MNMDNELIRIRGEIDKLDEEILSCFQRRMDAVREVAMLKGRTGLPVYYPEREREILERVGQEDEAARKLFGVILELSRELQRDVLEKL